MRLRGQAGPESMAHGVVLVTDVRPRRIRRVGEWARRALGLPLLVVAALASVVALVAVLLDAVRWVLLEIGKPEVAWPAALRHATTAVDRLASLARAATFDDAVLLALVVCLVCYLLGQWLVRGRRSLVLVLRRFEHPKSTRIIT